MRPFKRKGSPYFHYDFQLNGVRFCGSTKETSRRKAEIKIGHIRAQADSGALNKRRPITLNEATARYYEEVAQHQTSADTTFYQMENLVDELVGDTRLADITDNEISRYVAKRRAHVSSASVNRETQLLRRLFRRAEKTWKANIGEMPDWPSLLLPEPSGRVREMTEQEEARLFKAMREDMKPLVTFCLITGVRKSNAFELTWDQVDLQNRCLTFRTKSKKPGGEIHQVPITQALLSLFANLQSQHPQFVFTYVCQKRRGTRMRGQRYPWTKAGLNTAWRRAIKASGVSDFRFHDLRHTAASRTHRACGNLNVICKMLGHSSITMTQRYAHVVQEDVLAAMEATAESRNTPAESADVELNTLENNRESA